MPRIWRTAAIGATGKGGYGHGLDSVLKDLAGSEFVAIADDDATGLAAAGQKFGVTNLYADYHEMLAREKPDVVSVGPRWVDGRVAMVTAAAEAGCHIYCEKPLAGDLESADRMLSACERAGVKMAVAHQFRAMPPVRKAKENLLAGNYGRLLRMRARPKDDARGGGEDLIVHGTHLLDLMVFFAGPPRWVSGHVAVDGRDIVADDRHKATEPLGPVAGDSVAATYGFDNAVHGSFDTTLNALRDGRMPYGVLLECEEATLLVRSPGDVWVYPASAVIPENPKFAWERIWVEEWHFYPDHMPRPMNDWLHRGNLILVQDLFAAIDEDRPPLSTAADARLALELIQGVYASHLVGGLRLPVPLAERSHPLGTV